MTRQPIVATVEAIPSVREVYVEQAAHLSVVVDTVRPFDEVTVNMAVCGIATGTGAGDYERLTRKPSIDSHVLIGDSTHAEIGINLVTFQQIDNIIYT